MKNRNIIIVKKDYNNLFFKYYDNVYGYYKCEIKNPLFRIMRKLNMPLNIFYGKWKNLPDGCKYIVFFDVEYRCEFAKFVKKHNSSIKTIFWYWNVVTEKNKKFLNDKNIDEIWTYNRFDAEKYNLNYNPQFYYYKNDKNEKNQLVDCDVIFMGIDKGRANSIQKIKDFLEKNDINCSFYIIHGADDYMDYDEYLEKVKKSKCILDFSHTVPCGLSLRPLESIFLHKKLITNNKDIVNYKFYNKNNIYILDSDSKRDIKEFIDSPYVEISDDVIDYYSYNKWLERFKK